MFKVLLSFLLCSVAAFASGGSATSEIPDLTMTWIGFASLIIFVIGYYFVAAEEKYEIDKAKPALFIGTFIFILIALYYAINDLDMDLVHVQAQHLILEIAEIFFFLFVAMTYIESLIHMNVFDKLKYNLVTKGYSYRKLFWVTGFIAFFLSPIADNLTTALILSTVLITIEKKEKTF